jgi:hypothetical protein
MRSLGEVVRKISLLPAFESGGKCGPSPDQSRGAHGTCSLFSVFCMRASVMRPNGDTFAAGRWLGIHKTKSKFRSLLVYT